MFNNFILQGIVKRQYAMILSLLLSLRQCCDHPFLLLSRANGLLKKQDDEERLVQIMTKKKTLGEINSEKKQNEPVMIEKTLRNKDIKQRNLKEQQQAKQSNLWDEDEDGWDEWS